VAAADAREYAGRKVSVASMLASPGVKPDDVLEGD
jgi:hypothetical protein